jgi:large subunit ribosomal protein L9
MKVLLRKNVPELGKIGEVVDVNAGYARNYLLPRQLAAQPTQANIKAVEAEKQRYLEELTRQRADLEARAAAISGKEIAITARANEEGVLYGSVGPAQIVAALAAEGIFLDADNIGLDSPIRRLDKYDVQIVFGEDVRTTIQLWVVPVREEGVEPSSQAAEDKSKPTE